MKMGRSIALGALAAGALALGTAAFAQDAKQPQPQEQKQQHQHRGGHGMHGGCHDGEAAGEHKHS